MRIPNDHHDRRLYYKECKAMDVENIKKEYPIGIKVQLFEMDGEPQMPAGLKGTVTGVDDVGQIHVKWENGSSLAINPDVDAFRKVEPEKIIKVLLIKPNEAPEVIEIADTLEAMQELVGGYIEEYLPFMDDAAIVCNEEGKLLGLPFNRAIYEGDNIIDVMTGNFFIANAPPESDSFESLTDEMIEKYQEMFRYPEKFYQTESGLEVIKYKL